MTSQEELGAPIDLIVEKKRIKCCKKVLMEKSDYFSAMFSSNMKESQATEVELKDESLKFDHVNILVNFMHEGKTTNLDLHLADDLLEIACMLQIQEAIDKYVGHLSTILTHSNCLGLMIKADLLALHGLYNESRRHALFYFPHVIEEEEFVNLSESQLIDYLSDSGLNCSREVCVLKAVTRWLDQDSKSRQCQFFSILQQCLHPEDFTKSELEELENIFPPGCTSSEKIDYIRKCRNTVASGLRKPFRTVPVTFMAVGVQYLTESGEKEPCDKIYQLDASEKVFKCFSQLSHIFPDPSVDMGYRVCVVGENLYVTGGEEKLGRNTWLRDVWKLDQDGLWSLITQLPCVRRHHGICSDNMSFYLLGGFSLYRKVLKSFQQYNTVTGEWTTLPSMPEAQVNPVTTLCQETVYTLSSKIDTRTLYSYNLAVSSWTRLDIPTTAPMTAYYMTAYRQELYVLLRDAEEQSKLIKFPCDDPANEIVKHTFTKPPVGCLVRESKLWVFEGENEEDFVSYDLTDFSQQTLVGRKEEVCLHNHLVAVPNYPAFR